MAAGTPAGCPARLTGSAVATFSNGDPPQALKQSQNGNWSGTWQPRTAATSQVTVKVNAAIPEQNLKGTAQISGGLRTNLSVPIITPGAVLSSASLVAQSPIAPGSLISILGSSLADSLAGTAVLINSSDSAELEGLCHRVYVLSRGRVVRELVGNAVTEGKIVSSFVDVDRSETDGHDEAP